MPTERPDQDVMTNPRADRVRKVARLAGRSAPLRDGRFLAEGPQPSREALRAHLGLLPGQDTAPRRSTPWPPGEVVDAVYVSARLLAHDDGLAALVDQAAGTGVLVRRATDEVLTAMADAVTAQGIITVCRLPGGYARGSDSPRGAQATVGPSEQVPGPSQRTPRQELGQALPADVRLVAVLCRVQDPGNAGTIVRAADAAGVDAVVLTGGSVDVFNPKTVRSTAGSLFHLPVVSAAKLTDTAAALRDRGIQVLAADGHGEVRLDQAPAGLLEAPTAWLFGNEAQGLAAEERALAVHRVAVPLYGGAESLNVATAATVCLYASAMAQHPAPAR